jgi:hypothetical protein
MQAIHKSARQTKCGRPPLSMDGVRIRRGVVLGMRAPGQLVPVNEPGDYQSRRKADRDQDKGLECGKRSQAGSIKAQPLTG